MADEFERLVIKCLNTLTRLNNNPPTFQMNLRSVAEVMFVSLTYRKVGNVILAVVL